MSKKELIIQDVCNAIITKGDKVVANTKLQMSSIEGSLNTEELRAGLGNKKFYVIKNQKDMTLNFRNAVFSEDWVSLTQGVDILDSKTVEVTRAETICIEDGKVSYDLKGTPVGDEVKIEDDTGVVKTVTTTGTVLDLTSETTITSMEEIVVIYKEEVTGSSIEFDAEKFPGNYKVELQTIAYDLDGNIHSDIFFIFPNCSANGELNLSFEAGSVITPEISFDVLQPKCGSAMGEMINVPRP